MEEEEKRGKEFEVGIGQCKVMREVPLWTVFSWQCLHELGELISKDKCQELWMQKVALPTTQTLETMIPGAEPSTSSNTNSPFLLFLTKTLSTKTILVYVNHADIIQLYIKLFLMPKLKIIVPLLDNYRINFRFLQWTALNASHDPEKAQSAQLLRCGSQFCTIITNTWN